MVTKVIQKIFRKVEREVSLLRSGLSYNWRVFRHTKSRPVLDAESQRIVNEIRTEGLCVTSLEALSLPLTEQLWTAASAVLPKNPLTPPTPDEFVYLVRPAEILAQRDIYLWGLQDRMLDIVENYLEVPVAYRGPFFQRDFANGQKTVTRLWHKDPEDHRILKAVVYLSDVNLESGPLECISSRFNSRLNSLRGNLFYSDGDIEKLVEPRDWLSCTGRAGTVVFFDPHQVFHRGRVPVLANRDSIFYNYHSREPIKIYSAHWQTPFSNDDLLQLSTTLSPRQRECVFWWEHSANSTAPGKMAL
jgi:hypothetical protein